MKKQPKQKNTEKKPLSPVLQGILFPVGFGIYTLVFHLLASLAIFLKNFGIQIVYALAEADKGDKGFFELLFDNFKGALANMIIHSSVEVGQNQRLILLLSLALALAVIAVVLYKKHKSEPIPSTPKAKNVLLPVSAILLGLGLGGVIIGFDLINGIVSQLDPVVAFKEGFFTGLLEPLKEGMYESTGYYGWEVEIKFIPYVLYHLLAAIRDNALAPAPGFAVATTTFLLQAVVVALVFGTGAVSNLKQKSSILAIIFCTVLFAVLFGSELGLIAAMLCGLLLALVSLKSDSPVPAMLFLICTRVFSVVLAVIRRFFGEYELSYNCSENPYAPRPLFPSFNFEFWTEDVETIGLVVLGLLSFLIAVVSVILLIAGVVLLIVSSKKKKGKVEAEEVTEDEAPIEDAVPADLTDDDDLWGNYTFTGNDTESV